MFTLYHETAINISRPILFFTRISLVEPGPVGTSFVDNLVGMATKVDLSTADQKSLQLMESFGSRIGELAGKFGQKPEEIAASIKGILLSTQPHIRYHTNENFGVEELNSKLSDLTGDILVEVLEKRYLANSE